VAYERVRVAHHGAGLGGPADSDGRVIWRVLTGALALLVEPILLLWPAGLFGAAILLQRSDTRR
jgi:hypothetical protein